MAETGLQLHVDALGVQHDVKAPVWAFWATLE
jgi:hypothetical protein